MAKKKIFIEALGLVESHFSGVGQYIAGILYGIDRIIDKKKLNGEDVPDIRIIIPYNTLAKFNSYGFKHLRPKLFPLPFYVMGGLDHKGKLPPLDLICGKGTYLFTRFATMPLVFSNSLVVIYDLSFELYGQYSEEKNAAYLTGRVKHSVKKAKKIITISESAKSEIIRHHGVSQNNITVATPAVDRKLFYRRTQDEVDRVKVKYGISGKYILALSNLEPRKNLDGLIDAYCNLPKSITSEYGLLLVGVTGWKTEKLFNKIVAKVKEGYNIMRPSHYVSDLDKPAIISGATMLVYPSHYEGFGMPPLEALACGVPVITADNSSLPEVVGDAGRMIDSSDTKGLEEAIISYLEQIDSLTKSIGTAGPERADKFSWDESAQKILDSLYEVQK